MSDRSFGAALWQAVLDGPVGPQRRALLARLIASPEFDQVRSAWRQDVPPAPGGSSPSAGGAADQVDDQEFVRLAYLYVLAREPDPQGLRHYTAALGAGETRAGVLRALMLSDEFEGRRRDLLQDQQLCELANPAKWDNEEWIAILLELGLSNDKLLMHRKPYEFTQLVYGCRRLGVLGPDASILSVGAGHELILFWLANHVARVVATDMYEGDWQHVQGREGDPAVLKRPEDYAPFPYRRERLRFMRMDGRRLAFRDGTFDIAYSLSSIEHFGGLDGAVATVREMGRVLRRGGVLVVATEYILEGPRHPETFLPQEIAALATQPGLELVQPIDEAVYRRYSYTPVDLYSTRTGRRTWW